MRSASAWTLIVVAVVQLIPGSQSNDVASGSQQPALPAGSQPDPKPLFLTPYIDNCSYYEAREKSKIPYAQSFGVTAYSGYITVNKTAKSNLFFLLSEVEGNSSDAPLLLWTQGGPGLSAFFGLFLENGPVDFIGLYPNYTPILQRRINTLQKNMSVLYLDLPVGAGFSFTEDQENGYPTNLEAIVEHVKEFLTQFMKVFSEYANRDFYLAGESYAASLQWEALLRHSVPRRSGLQRAVVISHWNPG
ncbi:probable serine carboxypeptidase CPVL [Dermacentor albipictus]|uniref:probable serine carboxypeptidase CPVL n=1 Tax=Dermacentor albipictus TaxID=60249 RepID=UPI0038FCADB2